MRLKGHFPEAKFAKILTSGQQLKHVLSEAVEVAKAWVLYRLGLGSKQRVDEEMADLLHSAETYFRIRELEGLDVPAVFKAVVQKNNNRGYYN